PGPDRAVTSMAEPGQLIARRAGRSTQPVFRCASSLTPCHAGKLTCEQARDYCDPSLEQRRVPRTFWGSIEPGVVDVRSPSSRASRTLILMGAWCASILSMQHV